MCAVVTAGMPHASRNWSELVGPVRPRQTDSYLSLFTLQNALSDSLAQPAIIKAHMPSTYSIQHRNVAAETGSSNPFVNQDGRYLSSKKKFCDTLCMS